MVSYVVGGLSNQSLELVEVEVEVFEFHVVSVIVVGLEGLDEGIVLPCQVIDTPQPRQVFVAVGVFAVVKFEQRGPLGEEHEVCQPSSVDADEDVSVAGDFQLIFERHLTAIVHLANRVPIIIGNPLEELVFVENSPVFSAARQKRDSQLWGFNFLGFYLQPMQDVFGEGVE